MSFAPTGLGCKSTHFYSAVNQIDNVTDDFIVGIIFGCGFGAASAKQLFRKGNAFRLKAIRSDLSVFDDGVGLVNFKCDFYAAPWKTGFFRGLELLPTAEKELVRRDFSRNGLHFIYIN